MKRVLYVVSEDWAFLSHRLHIAEKAVAKGYSVAVLTKVTKNRHQIESAGIKVFEWGLMRGSLSPFNGARVVIQAVKTIFAYQPHIIHVVAQKPVIVVGFASLFFKKLPTLNEFGGVGFIFSSKSLKAQLLRIFVSHLLRWFLHGDLRFVLMQNKDDKALFEAAKIVSVGKLFLVPGAGVEMDLYKSKEMPTWSENTPAVVALPARLLWDKGVKEFVRMAATLKGRGFNARFVLIGGFDPQNSQGIPNHVVSKWVASGAVEYWGRLDNVASVYHLISIVCFPSYREGLPKALLEAASCARPIVCFDVPGCREVVQHEVNGFLVEFKNETELMDRVCQLLSDKDLSTKMGIAGHKIISSKFESGLIADQIMGIWQKLLK